MAASAIEGEIRSTPHVLRRVLAVVRQQADPFGFAAQRPAVFLGCGASHCVGVAAASLLEAAHGVPAQAVVASEYRPRPGWTHVAISRTGQTTELLTAMRRARESGIHVNLLLGERGAPAEAEAATVLVLECVVEAGIIQTRFTGAALLALRRLIEPGSDLDALPDEVEAGLDRADGLRSASPRHVVFLGSGWRLGVALAAALNLEETAQVPAEAHQTMEYRHGPIAAAEEGTLVWCLDDPAEGQTAALLADIRATGAEVVCRAQDPLVSLAQAQLLSAQVASDRGVDPTRPRNLARSIVLS